MDTLDPPDIKTAYDAYSDEVKQNLAWKIVKQNKSWDGERVAVKSHLEKHGSLSLCAARKANLVPKDTDITQFKKCVIKPLVKSGYPIEEQKGTLSRNAIRFHTPGNAHKVIRTKSIFTEPSEEAAIYVVNTYINGQAGSINIRKEIEESKQFPFTTNKLKQRAFNKQIIDKLPKGCKATGRLFVYVNEVKE